MKIKTQVEEIKNKIRKYDFKKKTREFVLPNPYTNPCLSKIWYQLDLNAAIEAVFLSSFLILAITSYLSFDEDFHNYPLIVIFIVQITILFFAYTKKLFERNDNKKEWFKTASFEKITLFYLVTRRQYFGHILAIIILMAIATVAPYSVEIVSNYDKEKNENIVEGFMDMYKDVVIEERELINKLLDMLSILPWAPLVFLINSTIIKAKLFWNRDFEYYFAYVILKLIVDCKEGKDTSKFLLFKNFLEMYEKYIKTALRLSLDNIDKIYSKVIANPKKSQDQICDELLVTFDDKDTYKTLKFLSQLIDEQPIVKKQILSEKLRLWVAIIFSGILVFINIVREIMPIS